MSHSACPFNMLTSLASFPTEQTIPSRTTPLSRRDRMYPVRHLPRQILLLQLLLFHWTNYPSHSPHRSPVGTGCILSTVIYLFRIHLTQDILSLAFDTNQGTILLCHSFNVNRHACGVSITVIPEAISSQSVPTNAKCYSEQ